MYRINISCSYCGRKHEENELSVINSNNDERRICANCMIKAFDEILRKKA